MKNLERIGRRLESHFEKYDEQKEIVLKISRKLVRKSSSIMRAMHQEKNVENSIQQLFKDLKKLINATKNYPKLYYSGFVKNAFQEISEALIVYSIMEEKKIPDPDDLNITYNSYILGLGDAIGELRRFALDAMLNHNVEEAKKYLEKMEELYDTLMSFHFTGVRRKQDVARAVIEKTKGELIFANNKK